MSDQKDAGVPGHDPRALHAYWAHGEGAAKIRWNTDGDFDRCVTEVGKYIPANEVKGYCAKMHHEVTGMWPGDKQNRRNYKIKGPGSTS